MQIDVLCGLVDRSAMDIFPYEPSLKGLRNRTSACFLHMVGKPVLKRTPVEAGGGEEEGEVADPMGAWMMDAFVRCVYAIC